MSRIFVNKIDIDASNIDYASIDRQYDFYLIENHGEKFKPNARIFDESLVSKNVVAVQYTFGPSFILMLKKLLLFLIIRLLLHSQQFAAGLRLTRLS